LAATLTALALVTIGPAVGDNATRPGAPWPGSQGCLGSGTASVAWAKLRNPILSYDSSAVRDPGVRVLGGTWHVFFTSAVGSGPQWRIASVTSADLNEWSSLTVWPDQSGTAGVASPDITRAPRSAYVVTYESNPRETDPPGQDKIYYRTSSDLQHWSAPRRLAASIHPTPSERLIDPALAWTHHGVYLGYKYGDRDAQQHFEIAWSPSGSLDGPWQFVGRPNISVYDDTIENYQFFVVDGVWHLLATSNNLDRPWLFTMTGNPDVPDGWLQWSQGRELEVPAEAWNRAVGIPSVDFEQENSAYLCDASAVDGYFYLFYVGTNELRTYGGWGHTKLGVARSTDLINWEVPCGPTAMSTPLGCQPG
jgi:hypothetical protein